MSRLGLSDWDWDSKNETLSIWDWNIETGTETLRIWDWDSNFWTKIDGLPQCVSAREFVARATRWETSFGKDADETDIGTPYSNNVESKYLLKTATHLKGSIFPSLKRDIISFEVRLGFLFCGFFKCVLLTRWSSLFSAILLSKKQ